MAELVKVELTRQATAELQRVKADITEAGVTPTYSQVVSALFALWQRSKRTGAAKDAAATLSSGTARRAG